MGIVIFLGLLLVQDDSLEIKDPWISEDKFYHFTATSLIVGSTYHLLYCRLNMDEEKGRIASIGVAISVSILKELYDLKRKRHFSWKDLVYDILGIGAGYFIFIY